MKDLMVNRMWKIIMTYFGGGWGKNKCEWHGLTHAYKPPHNFLVYVRKMLLEYFYFLFRVVKTAQGYYRMKMFIAYFIYLYTYIYIDIYIYISYICTMRRFIFESLQGWQTWQKNAPQLCSLRLGRSCLISPNQL